MSYKRNKDLTVVTVAVTVSTSTVGWEDAVKMMVYITPGCEVADVRAARTAALQGNLCASTLLGVRALATPELFVEVDLIAAKCKPAAAL